MILVFVTNLLKDTYNKIILQKSYIYEYSKNQHAECTEFPRHVYICGELLSCGMCQNVNQIDKPCSTKVSTHDHIILTDTFDFDITMSSYIVLSWYIKDD